ncbi:MAG TPA: mycofactocin-associated electron transfer flavoprotein alpha subunit [Streptosporangiaceae bacterium]
MSQSGNEPAVPGTHSLQDAATTPGTRAPSGTDAATASRTAPDAVAVIPVRDGEPPLGADETVAECGGNALLIGAGTADAAAELRTAAAVRTAEAGPYAPAAWARALAPLVSGTALVMLPAGPDGRDLAPRLAAALGRPLWAGATAVLPPSEPGGPYRVAVARYGGRVLVEANLDGPSVATLVPGVAGVAPREGPPPEPEPVTLTVPPAHDPEIIEIVPPTAATMDLAEAPRVFAGGAGLGSAAEFALLTEVAARADASMGATRIVVDAGWVPFPRQIGTTGTAIAPELYVAFGISGAVQHITGIGDPAHVIAVNTDPSCPMMSMADLAVVSDAPGVLRELARLLDVPLPAEEAAHA